MDHCCLHGVQIVKVRAQSQQLVDVQIQRVLLVGAGEGSVTVGTNDKEQVIGQFLHIHLRYNLVVSNNITLFNTIQNMLEGQQSKHKHKTVSQPTQIALEQKIFKIAAGGNHSYAIAAEKVYFWGHKHMLPQFQGEQQQSARIQTIPVSVNHISTGPEHTFAWNDREVYCWGSNDNYELGLQQQRKYGCVKVQLFEQAFRQGRTLQSISCGEHHSLAIFKNNNKQNNSQDQEQQEEMQITENIQSSTSQIELFAWGQSDSYQLTINTVHIIPEPTMSACKFPQFTQVFSRSDYNVAICNQKVYSWGCNMFSRLGIATTHHQPKVRIPKYVSIPAKIHKIGIGTYHVIALSTQGQAYSWGKGNQGQLGIDKFQTESRPTKVLCQEPITDVACGQAHTLVLLKDGRLKTCGSNTHKALGHLNFDPNDKKKRCKRLQLVQGTEFMGKITMLACGSNHNLVMNTQGKVLGWGANQYNQILPQLNQQVAPLTRAPKHPRKQLQIIVDNGDDYAQSNRRPCSMDESASRLADWKRRYDQFLQIKKVQEAAFLKEFQEIMAGLNKVK